MGRMIETHGQADVEVEAIDQPGEGGASGKYRIQTGERETRLVFQTATVAEAGRNGLTMEAVLAVVLDRLMGFQAGKFACAENAEALAGVKSALLALGKRTALRQAAGVEGRSLTLAEGAGIDKAKAAAVALEADYMALDALAAGGGRTHADVQRLDAGMRDPRASAERRNKWAAMKTAVEQSLTPQPQSLQRGARELAERIKVVAVGDRVLFVDDDGKKVWDKVNKVTAKQVNVEIPGEPDRRVAKDSILDVQQ